MKRRLMIARALVHQPKILILDEPTAGVDVELRASMWDFIRELNESGTTIILTTHYLEEAEELCERIGIINLVKLITLEKKNKLIKLLEGEKGKIYARQQAGAAIQNFLLKIQDSG